MKDAILVDINRKENLFNMRKNINKIVGLTLCIGMLTGCAQTPESSLVKPKGSKVENAYTETEGVDMVNEDSSENTKDKNTAVRTTIRDLLNAPETYKSQTTDDSAKLVVNTDATVEIPDVEKISAISVTPAEVTQDLLDRITDAFFSEAKLYTSDSYYTQTKDEIKKTLDELKEDVANGNLDPYNYGTDEDGNYIYDIYGEIEMYEQEYESAPETKTLVEGRPVAGSHETENGTAENDFSGVAQMPDRSEYFYKTSSYGSDTLSVKIRKTAKSGGEKLPADTTWFEYTSFSEGEKPTEESIGISLDEAKEMLKTEQDEYSIPLKTLYPNVTTNQIGNEAFPDMLSSFSTSYTSSGYNRSTNIELAAKKLDGYVLMPGETASYNQIVGQRTKAAGFKEGAAYSNGKVVQEVGGGICQVSSTLYNAVLYANLEIVERYNHGFAPSYVKPGLDATVSWGGPDFKFKNNRDYPIRIRTNTSGKKVRIYIYGLKTDNDYKVVLDAQYVSSVPFTTTYQKDSSLASGRSKVI